MILHRAVIDAVKAHASIRPHEAEPLEENFLFDGADEGKIIIIDKDKERLHATCEQLGLSID